MAKMNIKKGDKVKVLCGKDRGAEGIVIASKPSVQRVVVEGVNMMKKAMRPTQNDGSSHSRFQRSADLPCLQAVHARKH